MILKDKIENIQTCILGNVPELIKNMWLDKLISMPANSNLLIDKSIEGILNSSYMYMNDLKYYNNRISLVFRNPVLYELEINDYLVGIHLFDVLIEMFSNIDVIIFDHFTFKYTNSNNNDIQEIKVSHLKSNMIYNNSIDDTIIWDMQFDLFQNRKIKTDEYE